MRVIFWKPCKSIVRLSQKTTFWHFCRRVRLSRSGTPATQKRHDNLLGKERFCSFPHRHGEARGKPETRDETCWSIKTSISCETSSNFHTGLLQNRRFPTSFLMSLKICYLKINVPCKASVTFHHISENATPAAEIARCHHFTQPWQCDSQKTRNTTRLECKVLRLPRQMQLIVLKRCESSGPATQMSTRYETCWTVTKCHACMPRETRLRSIGNLQSWPLLQNSP